MLSNKTIEVHFNKELKNHKIKVIFEIVNTYQLICIDLEIKRDHNKILRKMLREKFVKSAPLGSGKVYLFDARKYLNLVLRMLSKDQFFLFNKKLKFKKGRLPFN